MDFPRSRKKDRMNGIDGMERNSPFTNGISAIAENGHNPRD